MSRLTRRGTLAGSLAVLGGGALGVGRAHSQVVAADVPAPSYTPESGASIRLMRPSKFVAGDETSFLENTERFTDKTGVEVKIEMQAWEDLRPKTAVAANVGAGPDIVLAWLDDPHLYRDKVLDLTELADYVGKRYGGWFPAAERYGRTPDGQWIGVPIGTGGGCITYRKSWLNEAGFEAAPTDFPGLLEVCKGLKKTGHPAGFALGNAVGDGNAWTHWILWGFGSSLVDENNSVVVDNPKTIEALEFAMELYGTFIDGTLAWLDPNNNKAFLAGQLGLTHNGISIYYVAKNSEDANVRAMADDIHHARPPMGPVGHPTETSLMVNAMAFKHTKYPQACLAYLQHMFDHEQYAAWQNACIGYWQHTLQAYDAMPFWTEDPKLTPFRDIARNMFPYGHKGALGAQSAGVLADYVVVNMFARVCSGQLSAAEAAQEAQKRAERYYKI